MKIVLNVVVFSIRTYVDELKNQQHQTIDCLKRDFNSQSLS